MYYVAELGENGQPLGVRLYGTYEIAEAQAVTLAKRNGANEKDVRFLLTEGYWYDVGYTVAFGKISE